MLFQSQVLPTEKKPEKARFCLAFFDLQKKPKVFKKIQNFKIWLQKSQIGNPVQQSRATKRLPPHYKVNLCRFVAMLLLRNKDQQ